MNSGLDLTVYKNLQLVPPALAVRSYLYQLKPVDAEKSSTESLTSFINRLAEAHGVSTGSLISQEVATVLRKEYLFSGQSNGLHKIYNRTNAINGLGVMAIDWVKAMETLTLVGQLRRLTLLDWVNVFPSRNLLRQEKAWCSRCYQEWSFGKQVVYDPLIWVIDAVKVCQRHQSLLDTYCMHCKQQMPWLDWWSRPGYCSKCKQWLGTYSNEKSEHESNPEEFKWKIWVVNNIEDLLSTTPHNLPKEIVAQSLLSCINLVTSGNIAEFSRILHLPKNTVWLWQAGKNLPPLDKLLRICYVAQVPLINFLIGKIPSETSLQVPALPNSKISNVPRPPGRTFDKIAVGRALETELLSHKCPPPTAKEVANRLGYDARFLRERYPELCCSISRKYSCYRRACRLQRLELLCKEIQSIAFNLHEQGIYPTRSKVSSCLIKPGCFRELEARDALRNAHRILGLN
jgi:hypothetical protein